MRVIAPRDVIPGTRRQVCGYRQLEPLPLRWVYLHVLAEFAQHCGHADIIREHILNGAEGRVRSGRWICGFDLDFWLDAFTISEVDAYSGRN
jgi:hypothetical protein